MLHILSSIIIYTIACVDLDLQLHAIMCLSGAGLSRKLQVVYR